MGFKRSLFEGAASHHERSRFTPSHLSPASPHTPPCLPTAATIPSPTKNSRMNHLRIHRPSVAHQSDVDAYADSPVEATLLQALLQRARIENKTTQKLIHCHFCWSHFSHAEARRRPLGESLLKRCHTWFGEYTKYSNVLTVFMTDLTQQLQTKIPVRIIPHGGKTVQPGEEKAERGP